MGKRQIAAEQTRIRLILAAKKLIEERGFDNVGVEEITAEAGVSKGSFYTYFKRKEDVVGVIARTNFDALRERSKELEGDASDKVSAFLMESVKYIMEGGLKLSQQWFKCGMEPELTDDVSNKLAYDMSAVREILDAAVVGGELSPETPVEKICQCAVAAYYGAGVCWCVTNGALNPASLLEDYCAIQLRNSLKAYRTDGK